MLNTATAAPYSYTLNAKATDTLGQSSVSNYTTVTVATPPVVSLTSLAANANVVAPGSFTLTANAWGTSSALKSVSFYNGTTLLGTATAAPYSYVWNNVAAGSYSLTAIATDNNNVTATSSAVNVTVTGTSQPPAVSLTSPAANATTTAPGSFTLTASASSICSTIAKVDFYNGTTLLGTATAAPYTFTWSNVPAGTYSLTAKATDALNVSTTSTPVSVTVNAASVQTYYIHADQLDTPRQITDINGIVVWQWDNVDPFGNNMANENPNGAGQFSFNLRFPGQYFDRETSLNYNINRDYDSSIGRYIESDPIGLNGGVNTYAYVGGNPLSKTDPQGLFEVHGNWCGPNWTGGHEHPYSPAPQGYYLPPTDYTDASCERHDKCFATCRELNKCDKSARKACMVACNQGLAGAQRFGSSSGTSLAKSMAIWGSMQFSPDPGENDSSCDKCEKK